MRTTPAQRGRPKHRQEQHGQAGRASALPTAGRPARPGPVRQASVTRAAPAPAQRAAIRATGGERRGLVQSPSGPALSRRGAERPLRRSTGFALTAIGAILWLALRVRVPFLLPQRAGLILLSTGLLWLWIPVPAKRDRLQRWFDQLITFLAFDPAASDDARCSLDDLLEQSGDAMPADRPE
jgi:hypothetical protein